ncbi:diguanylate cyclase [Mycolicibacterium senegalense]|uniref:sensor domain-containing protein n=1 Tax=Mycolicibacterium senegalense TaxID=1796 RepID=UPI003AAE4EFA
MGYKGSAWCCARGNVGLGGRHAEDAAERRFRQLLDYCPDAICVHQQGKLVYINSAGARWMAAHSPEQLIGHEITRFVHPDSVGPMLARIGTLRHEGDVSVPSEAKMLRFDGATLDVEAVSVLTTWDGRPAYQVIFRDVTAQKAAQATLRFQAALVEHASDAIVATTRNGLVTSWNRAAETIYRRPASRALGMAVGRAVGAALDPGDIVAAGGAVHATHRALDGSHLVMRVSAAAMDDGYVLLCSDQTAVRRAEQQFQTVVSSLEQGVIVIDRGGRLKTANPAARRILGIEPDILVRGYLHDAHAFELWDADRRPLAVADIPVLETLRTGAPITGAVVGLSRRAGRPIWLSVDCRLLNPIDPADSPVLVSFSDVTEQRSVTERLTHQAMHDPLTGLPNRTQIEERMERLLAAGEPPAAVLFIDLDDFKKINDSCGHEAGDAVIRIAAQRMRAAVRDIDTVGRLGGDEFVVLLVGERGRSELDAVAARILERLSEPVVIAGATIHLTASIGVATELGDGRDVAEWLRHADTAMYTAKARGRHTSHFHDAPTQPTAGTLPMRRQGAAEPIAPHDHRSAVSGADRANGVAAEASPWGISDDGQLTVAD